MKHLSRINYLSALLFSLIVISCSTSLDNKADKLSSETDPLPSWNEGDTKSSIIDYVEAVTNENNPDFIPVSDRIATFDNDGTLCSEQPAYFQLFFAMDRIKALAPQHPEWKTEQPYKAVLDNDIVELTKLGGRTFIDLIMLTYTGNTTEEFEAIVKEWIVTAKHPRFERPYTDLVFQPMLELLSYLKDNEFKVFIVSGGGIDFMQAWVENVYGIPRDQVFGSNLKYEFDNENGKPVIKRIAELDFINDKAGKPISIHKYIGRKPVFAVGNSDGDLQMLQYAASNKLRSFMLFVHHTDSVREWAYDRESHIGRLDKGLDEAKAKAWTVVDMKNDWKVVYPFNACSK